MKPDLSNLGPSLVRTLVPIIVGAVGGYGVTYLHATTDQETELVSAGLAFVYYLLVRLLEHKWPKLGVLLGSPQAPVYTKTIQATVEQVAAAAVEDYLMRRVAPAATTPLPAGGPSWADLAQMVAEHGAPPQPH